MEHNTSEPLWDVYKKEYYAWAKEQKEKSSKYYKPDLSIQALVFTYLYPRLDANVSTAINHLLKAPFCVHPKTGKICIPLDPQNMDNFKVNEVPTLTQVINEMGSLDKHVEDGDSVTPPCL